MKETKKFNLNGYREFDYFIKSKEMFGWEYLSQKEMITYGSVPHYDGKHLISTEIYVNPNENYRMEARGKEYLEVILQRDKDADWYKEVCGYEVEYERLSNWYQYLMEETNEATKEMICKHFSISYSPPTSPELLMEKPQKNTRYIRKTIIFSIILLSIISIFTYLCIKGNPFIIMVYVYGSILIAAFLIAFIRSLIKAIKLPNAKVYSMLLEKYEVEHEKYMLKLEEYRSYDSKIVSILKEKISARKAFIEKRLKEIGLI